MSQINTRFASPVSDKVSSTALAIIQLVVAGKPGGNFFGGKSINFGTPYYAITIGLNVILTILIYIRLLRFISVLNRTAATHGETSKSYTKLASVFIESAALYSLVGIMFLVPFATGSQTSIAFGQVWAKLTASRARLLWKTASDIKLL